MLVAALLVQASFPPSIALAQGLANVDSITVAFWEAAHAATFHATACVGDALRGAPQVGAVCSAARPALHQAFETLIDLEVCCPGSSQFVVGGREETLGNLMIAPAGLVYLVGEAESLRNRADSRRQVEVAAGLVARNVLVEEQLAALGASIPAYPAR